MARVSSRALLWWLPALVSAAAAAVFLTGFWLGLRGTLGEPLGDPPPAPAGPQPIARREGQRLLLVLGDSLAKGTGDESGRGFAGYVFDAFRKRGAATLSNLAVNGAESGDVLAVVETPNVRTIVASADLILLSAGGNDLSHAVTRELRSPADVAAAVEKARDAYAGNLRAILKDLREANPASPIYVVGSLRSLRDPRHAGPARTLGPARLERPRLGDGPGVHRCARRADLRSLRRKAGPPRGRPVPPEPEGPRPDCGTRRAAVAGVKGYQERRVLNAARPS